MKNITAADNSKMLRIGKWLGLNQSPDGDTTLKMGEAAVMRNWRITREGHLQIRPGYAPLCTLSAGSSVQGMWSGYVGGDFHFLAACGGRLWDVDSESWQVVSVGEIEDAPTHMFGFGGKVYLLTGTEYYCWNGTGAVTAVEGYIPIVSTAVPPEGGGTLLERVNVLTGKRRAQFSPDGIATVFYLPEQNVDAVLSVEGAGVPWVADIAAGTVTFHTAPAEGVNTVTVTWRKGDGNRVAVAGMKFAEVYNGATDARVFLYGNGSNSAVYSDLDEHGVASAEYFPEMNTLAVDSENTPITAMIRHYDRLMAYKPDGAFCIQSGSLTLDTGEVTAAFTCIPVNREIGNTPPGQVRLMENNPVTLHGRGVYQWSLSSAGSRDERNAKRISHRAENTLSTFALDGCITFDDEQQQELYIICGDEALIYNYAADAWYFYTDFPALGMIRVGGKLLFAGADGRLYHFDREHRSNDGQEIDAYWESGAMDFGALWRRKYSTELWVAMKPESQARILVGVETDRTSNCGQKQVAHGLATFVHTDFAHFSFGTNRKPRVVRVRPRARKFAFYKLIISSCSASATATVLSVDLQVRYTGNVK